MEMAGKPLMDWRSSLAENAKRACREQGWSLTEGPVSVSILFRLGSPRRPKHAEPAVRPDIDKLARAVLDAISDSGSVWRDDCQVVRMTCAKEYGHPGVRVLVWAKGA